MRDRCHSILKYGPTYYGCGLCRNLLEGAAIRLRWEWSDKLNGSSLIALVMPEIDCVVFPFNNTSDGMPSYYAAGLWVGEQGELRRCALSHIVHRIDNIELPARALLNDCDWEDWRDEQ